MTARQKYSSVLILAMLFALTAGGGLAQEPQPSGPPQRLPIIEGAVSSEFSYQGLLQEGGSPVTGSRDMIFRLHSNAACTEQVGSNISRPGVSIIDGYFDVDLDMDQGDVNGQSLWLEVKIEGTSVACHEILPVPYALSLRPGAVISGSGTVFSAYSSDQYAIWAETESTSDYYTAIRGGAVGATGMTRGVTGTSESVSGIGVLGQAKSDTGVTVGVYGQIVSNSDLACGVYGLASATSGRTYGVRGDNKSTSGRGVQGRATATTGETYGVYGLSDSTNGGAGGYFEGHTGLVGTGSGADGYGGRFESAGDDAVRVDTAGDDGIHIGQTADNGVYIDDAGYHGISIYQADESGLFVGDVGDAGVWVWLSEEDGVRVSGAGDDGVYADTLQTSHEWGLYTPDKLHVGTTIGSSGPYLLVVESGDAGFLEPGDVVMATGLGQSFADSPSPITLVRRADTGGQPVVGIVYSRFVAEESVVEQEHEGQVLSYTEYETHSTDGPIAPGEYLLLCVLGPCQVKANAAGGAIQPGDALGVSAAPGTAALAPKLNLDGVAFYPPGVTFGTALDPLPDGSGLIHAFISTR